MIQNLYPHRRSTHARLNLCNLSSFSSRLKLWIASVRPTEMQNLERANFEDICIGTFAIRELKVPTKRVINRRYKCSGLSGPKLCSFHIISLKPLKVLSPSRINMWDTGDSTNSSLIPQEGHLLAECITTASPSAILICSLYFLLIDRSIVLICVIASWGKGVFNIWSPARTVLQLLISLFLCFFCLFNHSHNQGT